MTMTTSFVDETALKTEAHFKHSFTIEVDVETRWPTYIMHHSDIFGSNTIGYWAFGVAHDEALGWLVYEHGGEQSPDDAECARVAGMWIRGESLPERWSRINRFLALRAWEEGVKKWGVDWQDDTDSTREDIVLQLALLGELRYG